MTLHRLAPGERLVCERGSPVVCVVAARDGDATAMTVDALAAHTPADVALLMVPDDPEHAGEPFGPGLGGARTVTVAVPAGRAGFGAAVDAASRLVGPGDLVLVAAGVAVGPGWLEGLARAAYSDSTVVSATALTLGAGPLAVPLRGAPSDVLRQPDAAAAVAAASPRAYPRIESAEPHCTYLRRALLDRLGGPDPACADPGEALAELSARASALGMQHVAADDVFAEPVWPGAPAAVADGAEPPAGEPPVPSDDPSPLRRSLRCARMALQGLSVTIDARALGPGVGGTQEYTAALILALARGDGVRVRVVIAADLPAALARSFAEAPALEVVTYEQALAGLEPSDVVHRPQQIFSEDDLRLLRLLGERIVVTHQDLIAYRNAAYHESADAWRQYQRVTRLAFAAADRVVFFSEHARADARSEDLIRAGRGDVIGIGSDEPPAAVAPAPPPALDGLALGEELLVCVGADYAHKNRPFAIELLGALRRRGWDGRLVLAGPHVPAGSSHDEEQRLLAADPELARAVLDAGRIDGAQRAWLYERARAVVFPTLYEGFGLIPFEAARAGVPCLFAPQASLEEVAPGEATLVAWDAEASAEAAMPLLVDAARRKAHVDALRAATARRRWADVASRLLDTYRAAVAAPHRAASPRPWLELERETLIKDLADREAVLRQSLGIGLALVAEDGFLSGAQQRGLLRVASRPALRRLLLWPFGLLGRLGGAGRRGGRW